MQLQTVLRHSYTYDVMSVQYLFKIKYKLYTASGSAALPIEEIRVRALI